MQITLSWPSPLLSPNNRSHWAKKQPVKSAYRNEGYWKADALGTQLANYKHPVKITFYPPNNKPRDLDNLLSSCKNALDGIADGLGINDKFFRPITIDFGDPDPKNPRVVIEI